MIAGCAGLVVTLVVVVAVLRQHQREVRASEVLSEIKVPPNLSADPPPETAKAYLSLARDYAGTKAASRALLLYASTLFNQINYSEAQVWFDEFLQKYPNSPWVPQAIFGVASCLDAQGKAGEAITKYEELRRRFQTHPIVDEARLSLARLYEDENRLEEAMRIYEELVQTHAGSGLGAEAGMRRENMLVRFPQLAKTNVPTLRTVPSPDMALTSPAVELVTNVPPGSTNPAAADPPGEIQLQTSPAPTNPIPAPPDNP